MDFTSEGPPGLLGKVFGEIWKLCKACVVAFFPQMPGLELFAAPGQSRYVARDQNLVSDLWKTLSDGLLSKSAAV